MAGANSTLPYRNVSNDGRSGTFDRNMQSYLKNKFPHSYNLLDTSHDLNPKYKYFQKIGMRRPEAVAKNSITFDNDYNTTAFADIWQDRSFSDLMYATASEDKPGRLRDYRTMAAFSEVADALDEICDEFIVVDENKSIAKLSFKNTDLESKKQEEIQKEWSKYVDLFDLENNGWRYFRQFLVEGEVFFEQIIHEEYTREGIVAVENIPADLIDPVYNNVQNMIVKGFLLRKPIFDKNDSKKVDRFEYIPMEENQVVYITNASYNETKDFIVPFIENCRRAYRQLSMIEDSIVIHRMVHAPLRFVFNVDVGRLPVPQAEAYLRKLQSQYWASKTFDIDQQDVVKKYNPQSTLDSYWFAKRQGQEATTVEEIGGAANLGELSDLMYFIKKLYRSLKVPSSRLDPEDSFRDGTDILREELKFANMVRRQQQKFAEGIKKGFISHLKLREMIDDEDGEWEYDDSNIEIEFNPPSNFYDLRENQKLELKVNMYNSMIGTGKISDSYAKKKYLNWTDREILADRELRRKDAELDFELNQIAQYGPGWKEMIAQGGEEGMEGDVGGMDMGGGGGLPDIPDFSGGPADTSGELDDVPEMGGEAEVPVQ